MHRQPQGNAVALAAGCVALFALVAAGCQSAWPKWGGSPASQTGRGSARRSIAAAPDNKSTARSMAVAEDPWPEAAASETDPVVRQQSDDEASMFSAEKLENLKPKKMFDNVRQLTPWKRDEELARRNLQEGDDLFREKKFDDAIDKYKSAAFRWPDSVIEEDALFMLGECYFFTDRYPKASATYTKLFKKYSSGGNHCRHLEKAVARQFAIARYWEQLQAAKPKSWAYPNLMDRTRPTWDTTTNALACYQTVWMNDPTGPLSDDAVMAVANCYFVQNRFQDADFHYTQLREQHTDSEHLVDAYVLGLRAKMKTYQGPVYDGVPLQQSEGLAEQMLTQFPTELGDERPRVIEAKREIRERNAERHWEMAQYYAKNKYFGGTRYYCNLIVQDYPDTSFAPLAAAKITEVEGRPDNPPQKLKWLLDMIPARDRS